MLKGNTEYRGKSATAAPKARITALEPHLSTPWHLGVHRVADAMLMPQVCMWFDAAVEAQNTCVIRRLTLLCHAIQARHACMRGLTLLYKHECMHAHSTHQQVLTQTDWHENGTKWRGVNRGAREVLEGGVLTVCPLRHLTSMS